MSDLVRTSHAQLAALWVSFVCWTLTAAAMGVVQWRVWRVADRRVITSAVASVGVWRACFDSHALVSPEYRIAYCRRMPLTGDFVPAEIKAAQVLAPAALAVGLAGNAAGVYALRSVYFGRGGRARAAFSCAGALCALSSLLSLTPAAWNLRAVLANRTIAFPPEFCMPAAPVSQSAGAGIVVTMAAAAVTLLCGIVFLCYRLPPAPGGPPSGTAAAHGARRDTRLDAALRPGRYSGAVGKDNPAFEAHECL